MEWTVNVFTGALTIGLFPEPLKRQVSFFVHWLGTLIFNVSNRLVRRYLTRIPGNIQLAMKLIGPIITERLQNFEKYGENYSNKPVRRFSFQLAGGSHATSRMT